MKLTKKQHTILMDIIGEKEPNLCSGCKIARSDALTNYYATCRHDRTSHTFTTWADIEVVKEALEEKGLFEDFRNYTYKEWVKDTTVIGCFDGYFFGKDEDGRYRFCQLVAEFLEGV
jgi:hypothetical protein